MKRSRMPGAITAAAALLFAAGCSTARKPVAAAPAYGLAPDRSWIDIEPGWRLRVVTPLLRSGGYRLKSTAAPVPQGSTVELRTDSEFLGYELAYYAFQPKGRINLTSVEANVQGRAEPRQKPVAKLFDWPRNARFVRLVFLTRSSSADHDMAVLTARRYEDLAPLTAQFRETPEQACKATPYCSWIPGGIAVTAERRDAESGKWLPADRGGRPAK